MKSYSPIDVVNSALFKAVEKKKSLSVVQRYLRMKYKINISPKSLTSRAGYNNIAFS